MNVEQIKLVQSTWETVEGIAPQAAALFYQNLFEMDPSLQPLFKGNMEEQGMKLMNMIGLAVKHLNDLETLTPVLQNLSRRHVGYGVKNAHYATVGSALLTTLGQGLGAAFTPSVKDAWSQAYGWMSEVMIKAAGK